MDCNGGSDGLPSAPVFIDKIAPGEFGKLLLEVMRCKMKACQSKRDRQVLSEACNIIFGGEERDEERDEKTVSELPPKTKEKAIQTEEEDHQANEDPELDEDDRFTLALKSARHSVELLTELLSSSDESVPTVAADTSAKDVCVVEIWSNAKETDEADNIDDNFQWKCWFCDTVMYDYSTEDYMLHISSDHHRMQVHNDAYKQKENCF